MFVSAFHFGKKNPCFGVKDSAKGTGIKFSGPGIYRSLLFESRGRAEYA